MLPFKFEKSLLRDVTGWELPKNDEGGGGAGGVHEGANGGNGRAGVEEGGGPAGVVDKLEPKL